MRDGKARRRGKQRALSASAADIPAQAMAAAAVGPCPWARCFRSLGGRAGSLAAAQLLNTGVGCGLQPRGGSSCQPLSIASSLPSHLSPVPGVGPLLLQALRTVSAFLIGSSLIQMVLNEAINVKMLRFFF